MDSIQDGTQVAPPKATLPMLLDFWPSMQPVHVTVMVYDPPGLVGFSSAFHVARGSFH
jgi:hypothetical protein